MLRQPTRIQLAGQGVSKLLPHARRPRSFRRARFTDATSGRYYSYMQSLEPALYYRLNEPGIQYDVTDLSENQRDARWRESEGPPDERPTGAVDFDTSVQFSTASANPNPAVIQTYDYNPMQRNSQRTYVAIVKRVPAGSKFDSFIGNSAVPGPGVYAGHSCTLEFISDTSIYWYGCIATQFPFGWRWDNLPAAGTWWHLVFTVRDNNVTGDSNQPNGAQTVELFVNGVSVGNGYQDTPGFGHDNGPDSYWYDGGSLVGGGTMDGSSGQLFLGQHGNYNPSEFCSMAMDEFAVFERILNQSEITTLAAAGGWMTLIPATEVDTARVLTKTKLKLLTKATEVDTARTLLIRRALSLTPAVEVDSSRALSVAKKLGIVHATEVDTARALSIANRINMALGAAIELDEAQPLTFTIVPIPPIEPPVVDAGASNPELNFLELYRMSGGGLW